MSQATMYDLVRVLADQQAGLTEMLAQVDQAIEDMDGDMLVKAHRDIAAVCTLMEIISGEIADAFDPTTEHTEEGEESDDDFYLD